MNRPNFFIVGAPKCGTTTLYELLQGHPRIFMPERKEPYFFTPGRRRKVETLDEYLALFAPAGPEHIRIGEGSTDTIYTPGALEAVRAFAPDAKIIVMLREPVSLARSLHAYLCYLGTEDVSDFETAWRLQDERRAGRKVPAANNHPLQLQYGHVARLGGHVERARQVFPPENILVLFLEDMAKDPAGVYERTVAFLGLETDGRREFPRANVGALEGEAARLHGRLHQPLLAVRRKFGGFNAWIKSPAGQRIHGWLLGGIKAVAGKRSGGKKAPLNPEFRRELRDFFADDIALLQSLTGRDLSHWME